MTSAPTLRRVEEAAELSDGDLLNHGLSDEADVQFELASDREPKPGEKILEYGDGRENRLIGRLTRGTTDASPVAVYDILGRRYTMPLAMALLRLRKTYPADHPNPEWRGKRVFYHKAPRIFPEPTFPCPRVASGECRKVLFTALQRERHYKLKHPTAWAEEERLRQRDREERGIRAQERQAELMERLLARLAGAAEPERAEIEQALGHDGPLPFEPTAEDLELADADAEGEEMPVSIPDETWKRQDLIAWLRQNEYPIPEDWMHMNTASVWEYVRAFVEAGA